jgi:hypothetical protein
VRSDRLALLATLALIAVNLATTPLSHPEWALVPGALHGWRWPFLTAALLATAALATRPLMSRQRLQAWLPRMTLIAGAATLVGFLLFSWLSPFSWSRTPFLDDWPPRFQSTVEGLRLLRHGAFAGWQWNLLGGYATSTDITQSLTLLGAAPMTIFGDAIGFHLLHAGLFLAVPALVFVDLDRSESRALSLTAAGLVSLSLAGAAWSFMRSGDTNSLAGLAGVMAVLAASHRARTGERYGFTMLVLALTVTAYSHVAFFAYAVGLLALEAIYYGKARHVHRALLSAAFALVLTLPLTYELFRYPAEFVSNNVIYAPGGGVDWVRALRSIAYNVQVLFQPQRWFNDAGGLTSLFLPLVLLAAWRRDGRVGYYAWAALFAVALIRLNVPEAGYFFVRPAHLLVLFTPVVVAWFVTSRAWDHAIATGLVIVTALCFQIAPIAIPHVTSVAAFQPALIRRITGADARRVLVENNPHRDVDGSPNGHSEPSLYGTHYEALLPDTTGKELYAGYWDGWQWTPFRGEMLAGGAWQGHLLTDADHAAFLAEMRRWGVRHLFVWSSHAKAAMDEWPELMPLWSADPWREYEIATAFADTRSVVTDHGRGDLLSTDPLGGVVRLTGVDAGDHVVVRTHFHPSWQIESAGRPIAPINASGQLGFIAPAPGTYNVTLVYPARRWLLVLNLVLLAGLVFYERHFAKP